MVTLPPWVILLCDLSGHMTSLSISKDLPAWSETILERQLVALERAAAIRANSAHGSEGVSTEAALVSRLPPPLELLEHPVIVIKINATPNTAAKKQRFIVALLGGRDCGLLRA